MKEKEKFQKEDVKILIIEDSLTQGEKLKFILEEEGFGVDWVVAAEQALEFLEEHTPSVLISDVLLPGMNGYEICSRIKQNERWKQIPVILLTTLSEPYDILKGLESGADNFITKPYNREYLLSRLEYLLVNMRLRSVSENLFFSSWTGQWPVDSWCLRVLVATLTVISLASAKPLPYPISRPQTRSAGSPCFYGPANR